MGKDKIVNENIVSDVDLMKGSITTSSVLNDKTVIPSNEYDCVLWDSNNLPIDVAASRAYMALKIGGRFIVEKNHQQVTDNIAILQSMFTLESTTKDDAIFVKDR